MRMILLVALMSSCSWVFQDRLKGAYDGRSEPQCSTSAGWPGLDLVFAGLNAIGGLAAASDDELSDDDRNTYLAGGLLWGGIHLASAITGFVASGNCSEAYSEWNGGETPTRRADDNVERERLARELGVEPTPAKPAPPKPRGYFCASSATTGLCAREKADCETARDAAIGAVADLGACALVESAHCFDVDARERCFPTADQCSARAGAATCEERK